MCDKALRAIMAVLSTPTGGDTGWPLYVSPSSGGLHPVRISVSEERMNLTVDPRATIEKYGPSGAVSAEIDLGAALPVLAALAGETGIDPVATPSSNGLAIACRRAVTVASSADACASITASLRTRRSHRVFGSDPVRRASIARMLRSARLLEAATRRMLSGLPPVSVTMAVLSGPDRGWHGTAKDALTVIPGDPPDAASLVDAACGQDFVSDCSAVAVISAGLDPDSLDVADAWAAGAVASSLHLAATATGMRSCIIGAIRADRLSTLDPVKRPTASVHGLPLLVVIGSAIT